MHRIANILVASVLVLCAALTIPALTSPAEAADLERSPIMGRPTVSTTILDLGSDTKRLVHLPQGRARLVRLPVRVKDVIIADPEIADVVVKSPQLLYLLGKATGGTNVILLDAKGREILELDVAVFREVDSLRASLKRMLPEEMIEVSALGTSIILSGTVRTPRAAEDARLMAVRHVGDPEAVINRLRIAQVQQVSLRVRIAEVQRTIMKDLNLNGSVGTHRAGPSADTTSTFFSTLGLTKGGGQAASGFGRAIGGNPGLALASGGFLGGAAMLLDALESDGLIRTLAEPILTALSGEEASFLAGGEFPVPTGVDNNGRVKIEFKQFGVSLSFRPVVLDDGRINLNVATEVSEIDDANAIILSDLRIPALKTRRASTTVELASGATLVIGGLLQNNFNNVIDGFPGLRNIPILGALFRSVAFQRQETELVITVTPYLVEPFNDNDVVLPTDGYVPPNDLEMYLLGKLQVAYGRKEGEVPDGKPVGQIGYIVK